MSQPDRDTPVMASYPRAVPLLLGGLLFVVLMGIYLLTYRGWPMSGDEIFIYDSATTFARQGEFYRIYEYNTITSPPYRLQPGPAGEPWLAPLQEPLMALLIAPLVRLGRGIEGVGTMHVVWLANMMITALTAVSLYGIARWWGAGSGAAWGFGLAYGIGTNAWFYSRLLFREPLNAFLILWAFVFAVQIGRRWATGGAGGWVWLGLGLALLLGIITKVATILFSPAILIAIWPPLGLLRRRWRLLLSVVIGLVVTAILFYLIMSNSAFAGRYALSTWLQRLETIQWAYVFESILGYQVSPGRSVWLYSPVLLVGLLGVKRWLGQGDWRIAAGPAAAVLLLSAWYGIALTVDWLGGWGWGPRYLLPMLPVLMLWVLPVWSRPATPPMRLIILGLVALGAGLQFLGMAVPISNYFTDLFRAGRIYDYALIYSDRAAVDAQWGWMEMIWTWAWSPIRYHLTRLDPAHLDIAWAVAPNGWFPPALSLVGIALGVVAVLVLLRLRPGRRFPRVGGLLGVAALVLIIGAYSVGLAQLRDDARYVQEWPEVAALIDQMNTRVHPNDAVFIDRHLYTPLFMNFFKPLALVATLPYAPGEFYGPNTPQIISDDLAANAGEASVYALRWSAQHAHSLWLVASAGPFETDKRRPIERYLSQTFFPIEEIMLASHARAIRFWPLPVPQGAPANSADYVFGQSLRLAGYDMPAGTMFAPGAVLPVSLMWQVEAAMSVDYNVSLYLQAPDGRTVVQRDGPPLATFGYTSQWTVGARYRDPYALQLPADLPPSDYVLRVAVYDWRDGQRLPVLPDDQAKTALLSMITVR